MGIGGYWHWIIVAVVALVLFGGKGKIPSLMKDMGKGITAFKRGLKDEDPLEEPEETKSVENQSVNQPVNQSVKEPKP